MAPTLTIFRVIFSLWCVLPLLSLPLHYFYLSFPVHGSAFDSPEHQKASLYSQRDATQALFTLLSCYYWPLAPLWGGLDGGYLWIGGMYSSRHCSGRNISLHEWQPGALAQS